MRVWRWPVREALRAYLEKARAEQLEQYRFGMLLYALAAPWNKKAKPPDVPSLLKETRHVAD